MGLTFQLPDELRTRAARVDALRQLYAGEHYEYFVAAGRSRFSFRAISPGGRPYYTPCDLLGLISRKTADLLFGEAPRISHGDARVAAKLAALVERSSLHGELLAMACEMSWAGEAFLEVVRHDGDAYIRHVPVFDIHPIGPVGPGGQHAEYRRFDTAAVKRDGRDAVLVLETNYRRGEITRRVYEAGRDQLPLPLELWPLRRPDGSTLVDREATGLDRPSIVRFRNDARGQSDYTPQLIDAQDLLSAKHTQLSRVILRHAEPRLFMVDSQALPDGTIRADDEVFYGQSMDAMPRFLTWEAQLDAAMRDRDFARQMLLTIAEMPASFLGIKDDSTAETAAKMRLNAVNAIAKAQRKAAYVTGPLKLALSMALAIDLAVTDPGSIVVQIRDGIPDDEKERAEVIVTLRSAGAMSLRRALAMQQLDAAELDAELAELERERAQQTPSVLLGEAQEMPAADQPADSRFQIAA